MLGHRKLEAADYLAILKRRRVLIISCIVIFPIIGAILTNFISPTFLSQTLVLIEEQKVPDEYVKPVIGTDLEARLSSMKEQIMSRSRIQPIIEKYNLYNTSHMTMDDRVELARKAIDIKPIRSAITANKGLPGFFITFKASDAHTAQLVCGEITSLFLNENLRNRETAAEGTTDFLKGQLTDAKRNLDEQDAKLAAFQRQYLGKLPGEEGTNLSMLNGLNTQLEAATQSLSRMEQDKTYAESMLTTLQAGATPAQPLALGPDVPLSAIQSPAVQAKQRELQLLEDKEADLSSQYTPNHPDVIAVRRQISDLKKELAKPADTALAAMGPGANSGGGNGAYTSSLNQSRAADSLQIRQLQSQIRAADLGIQEKRREQQVIQSKLGMYQDRLSSTPQVAEEYKELTRDYATAQKFYEDLDTKMNHSKMATDLERRQEGEQFRVMDEPNLPDAPTFPNVWIFAAGGLVLGLMFGLSFAAMQEYKDTSIRNERDVWAFTRLPTLGIIAVAGEIHEEKHAHPKLWERILNRFKRTPTVKTDGDSLAGARG
jgi:polysaccharide chain length determinant protein (PEP-CTERM system associated)